MQIREIKDSEVFDSFVENSSNNHYMKTSMWGEFEQKQAKRSYQMLGFYEKDRLVATALVLKGSWFGHPYLYIPKGPCMICISDIDTFLTMRRLWLSFSTVYLATMVLIANGTPAVNTFRT